MSTTRREFLRASMAAPLVYGLGPLLRHQEAAAGGTELAAALAEMSAHRRDGLAIVVPAAARERDRLGKALEALIEDAGGELRNLLLELVWVCTSAKNAHALPGENVVLLDPRGERLSGGTIDFESADEALQGLKRLVRGPGRQDPRVRRARPADPEALVQELQQHLTTNDMSAFLDLFRRHAAYIVSLAEATTDPPKRFRLEGFLHFAYLHLRPSDPKVPPASDWKLPYGVEWAPNLRRNPLDACVTCGMAVELSSSRARRFVKFLE